MASGTDQIEREIVRQRDDISRKVVHLQKRVQGDIQGIGIAAKKKVTDVKDRVSETVEKVTGPISDQAANHPLIAVAGALAAGIALGMMSGGRDEHVESKAHSNETGGHSDMADTLGRLVAPIAQAVAMEVRPFVRDILEGFKDSFLHPRDNTTPHASEEETMRAA